jgi:hypothetical protein
MPIRSQPIKYAAGSFDGQIHIYRGTETNWWSQGNIHHHLMTLRSAGLVRIHLAGEGQMFFVSARKGFISEFKESLDVVLL